MQVVWLDNTYFDELLNLPADEPGLSESFVGAAAD